jgi:hypothetical protein
MTVTEYMSTRARLPDRRRYELLFTSGMASAEDPARERPTPEAALEMCRTAFSHGHRANDRTR